MKSAGSGEALLLRGKLLFSLTVKRRAIADAIRQIECRKPLSGASDRPRFRGMTLLRGALLRVFPPRGVPDCGAPLCTLRMLRYGNPCGRCACHGVTASRGIPLGIAAPRGSLPRGAPLRVVSFLGSFLLRAGPGFWGISVTSSSLRPFPGPPGHLPSAVPMRQRAISQFLPSHRTRQARRIFRAPRRAFRRRKEGGRGECGR